MPPGRDVSLKPGLIALFIAAAASATAATAAARHASAPSASRCGGSLWRMKTLSDAQRGRVQLTAQTTTIGAIRERRGPGRPPTRRTTTFQLHVWEVPAQITSFKLDPTGAVRLELFDNNAYIHAVIPSPACLSSKTRARSDIAGTWHAFSTKCGKATRDWQSLGAIVFVRGVGFWGQRSEAPGSAPNGAQLYPVTGFRVVVGCR